MYIFLYIPKGNIGRASIYIYIFLYTPIARQYPRARLPRSPLPTHPPLTTRPRPSPARRCSSAHSAAPEMQASTYAIINILQRPWVKSLILC